MKNKYPLVSIIIVNWNGGDIFGQCLSSLSKLSYPHWELIIIDNGSTDGSDLYHKTAKLPAKRVVLISNKENVGFAPANNQGVKVAKGELILLLNNDTKVTPSFLTKLVDRMMSDSSIGVIQPKIYMMDPPSPKATQGQSSLYSNVSSKENVKDNYLDNAGSFMTRTGFLEHWGFGKKDSKEFSHEREVFSCKGACMLTRKELIDKIGLFDPEFVSYFEESDYCWRVWLVGSKVLFYPDAHIFHKVGFTSSRLLTTEVNYHSMKNRIASMIKNLSFSNYALILVPHLVLTSGLAVYYALRLQFSKSMMIVKAYMWNIRNIRETLKKRNAIQKQRSVSDRDLFSTQLHKTNIRDMFNHFVHVEKDFSRRTKTYSDEIAIMGRVRKCLEIVGEQKVAGKIIVNVGSSFGWMEKKLIVMKPKRIIGIDPSESAISFAEKSVQGAEFKVGTAADLGVPDHSVDIVTMFDVIEHVPKHTEPEVFAEIHRVLKKGGVLLLSTPNDHFLTNVLDPAWYLGHRHYNSDALTSMLTKSDFTILKSYKRGTVAFSIYLLWLYISKWVFRMKAPRNSFLERIDDESFDKDGYHTLFVVAKAR